MIDIKFEYTDENGYFYSAQSKFEADEEVGYGILDELGRQFNTFLSQISYNRSSGDYIFMPAITIDEYCALEDYLKELRANKEVKEETDD